MAGWISSKLKVAENLLQQIDQQAAESLGKAEKPRRSPSTAELSYITGKPDYILPIGEPSASATIFPIRKKSKQDLTKVSAPPSPSSSSSSPKSSKDHTAIDWTELLSSPSPIVSATAPRSADGRSLLRPSPLRVVKKPGISKNSKGLFKIATPALSMFSSSNGQDDEDGPRQEGIDKSHLAVDEFPLISEAGRLEIITNRNRSKEEGTKNSEFQNINASENNHSEIDRNSGSDTETSSGSDSEEEIRRIEEKLKRKEFILAAKAARAAADAINEKEDLVERLIEEKQSLEKILEERERQQEKEASELQISMIESMEAEDLEKKKHNSTRMEALARLAELESHNAELAKLFATEQWNLEVAFNQAAELKQQIELKELAQEKHRRRVLTIKQQPSSSDKMAFLTKNRIEREILDAEYSFTCHKIEKLKDMTRRLEENIEKTKRETVQPTEVELELKKRLSQLTDHLIQKQTQVESLSSEKATLNFRIENLSSMYNEDGVLVEDGEFENLDIEAGRWQHSDHAAKLAFRERIRSGRQQVGLIIRQLDTIFLAGMIFLRRNTKAQFLSYFYLICLHLWVLYILRSHSQVSDVGSRGAAFSLEAISNSSGH